MDDVRELAVRQAGVVTLAQARGCGLSDPAIRGRLRHDSWRRVLPRVYLVGAATADTRAWAAALYVGEGARLTGAFAANRYGVRHVPDQPRVQVLAPRSSTARSTAFLDVVHSTRAVAGRRRSGLWLATSERAVADTARLMADLGQVRAMVADSVQRGICGLDRLQRECDRGPRRGSGLLRQVLDEVTAGARSAPEAALLAALRRSGLPPPLCNVPIRDGDGRVIAIPDFRFDDVRLIVEVDSREWHFGVDSWHYTMRRHNDLTRRGWTVLHFPPSRIRADLAGVVAEIVATYRQLAAA